MDKKKRGENWTAEEKGILRQLIARSVHIIENKSTKASANFLKNKEWKIIMKKLNKLTGKMRTEVEIKLAWKRMKIAAKANLLTPQQLLKTGGGQKPPSPEDIAVMVTPLDFIMDTNEFDSDAIQIMISKNKVIEEAIASPSTENTGILTPNIQEGFSVDIINDIKEDEETKVTHQEIKSDKPVKSDDYKSKKSKKVLLNSTLHNSLMESIKTFKKRQLEMIEIEHAYNIEVAKLKIRKLQLEISLLETKKNNH